MYLQPCCCSQTVRTLNIKILLPPVNFLLDFYKHLTTSVSLIVMFCYIQHLQYFYNCGRDAAYHVLDVEYVET